MSNLERTPTDADRYVYAAELRRVIDGDMVVLDIDLGVRDVAPEAALPALRH